ncbi:MAG: hypothetical protein F6K53_05460 [Moorea sp. SIO4A1]|uniref:hypothetical protein n=1 Tax=Moorena sp. SIO4A1 TaxID=2607835 RepID=UPI00144BA59C|nr:hypothetical protein [Moorena sp. SIO4A1]NEQ56885.1 hypothetical protein [Moorena sp. SIO4A1]
MPGQKNSWEDHSREMKQARCLFHREQPSVVSGQWSALSLFNSKAPQALWHRLPAKQARCLFHREQPSVVSGQWSALSLFNSKAPQALWHRLPACDLTHKLIAIS